MTDLLTDETVGKFLVGLGNYRVKRAQQAALQGTPDGISGGLLLALGLRESHLTNVEGGAKLVDGRWVAQDDPNRMDVGWTQISRLHHLDSLRRMPGVKVRTWAPVVSGKTAADGGYAPRFEEALQFTIQELREAQAYGQDHGVDRNDLVRFAIAAHNAGSGGAVRGFREGDVDKYTARGDYSAWVLATKAQVNGWLTTHPNWLA
jgi:hypothetical protein